MDRIFFIDLNGQVIENPAYESHIGLAIDILSKNEELQKAYKESGYDNQELFLVEQAGYTLGSASKYDKFLLINREKATKEQKQTAYMFVQQGYDFCFSKEKSSSRSI